MSTTKRRNKAVEEEANTQNRMIQKVDCWSLNAIKVLILLCVAGVVIQAGLHIPNVRSWLCKVERLEGVPFK